jgi:hypothetical protein
MLAGIDVGFLQWDLESTSKQWRDFSLTNIHTCYLLVKWSLTCWTPVVRSPAGVEIFIFSSTSRTVLRPTQWVISGYFVGVRGLGREADRSTQSNLRFGMHGVFPPLPIGLHPLGAVLAYMLGELHR